MCMYVFRDLLWELFHVILEVEKSSISILQTREPGKPKCKYHGPKTRGADGVTSNLNPKVGFGVVLV